eukprot:7375567-Pyramimonas_sp.AAC.1
MSARGQLSRNCGSGLGVWRRVASWCSKLIAVLTLSKMWPVMGQGSTITTINATSWGSFSGCLEALPSDAQVITLQEHHILDNDRLASFQREVADFGF